MSYWTSELDIRASTLGENPTHVVNVGKPLDMLTMNEVYEKRRLDKLYILQPIKICQLHEEYKGIADQLQDTSRMAWENSQTLDTML